LLDQLGNGLLLGIIISVASVALSLLYGVTRIVNFAHGEIIALGREAFGMHEGNEPWVEKGDRVFYAKYSGKRVEDPVTKEEYLVCNDEDVIGVIRNV